jgi:hypothetical protein
MPMATTPSSKGAETVSQAPLAGPRRTGRPTRPERAGTSSIPRVLVVDVGGTSVKMLATGQDEHRSFPSGPTLTPRRMVDAKELAQGWSYDAVSIGYPGPVLHGGRLPNRTTLGADGLGSISQRHSAIP